MLMVQRQHGKGKHVQWENTSQLYMTPDRGRCRSSHQTSWGHIGWREQGLSLPDPSILQRKGSLWTLREGSSWLGLWTTCTVPRSSRASSLPVGPLLCIVSSMWYIHLLKHRYYDIKLWPLNYFTPNNNINYIVIYFMF